MKVKMNDTLATPGKSYDRGQVYDVDDEYGRHLVRGGLAVELGNDGQPVAGTVVL